MQMDKKEQELDDESVPRVRSQVESVLSIGDVRHRNSNLISPKYRKDKHVQSRSKCVAEMTV